MMKLDNISNDQIQTQIKVQYKNQTKNEPDTITKEINKTVLEMNKEKTTAISHKDMHSMIDKANDFIGPARVNVKFQLHEKLDEYYVELVDSTTQEVIKEIPPKEMLDMYAEMAELMGLIVDHKI